jgi:hypothetical protein
VSQQLATLARAVGTDVVRQHGRGVVLTEAGLALAGRAEALLAAQRDAVEAARAATQGAAGTVRLGTFATVAAGLLPRLGQHHATAVLAHDVGADRPSEGRELLRHRARGVPEGSCGGRHRAVLGQGGERTQAGPGQVARHGFHEA